MPSTIQIEPFDAKFIEHHSGGDRTWRSCRVVGVSNTTCGPWFIAMVAYPDGLVRAQEMPSVYDEDAPMPE